MKIKPIWITVLILVVIFGGIGLAQLTGLWSTSGEGRKGNGRNGQPVVAGDYSPDEIRGSFSLQTVATAFLIDPDVMRAAFGLPAGFNLASLRTGGLAALYEDAGVDIGNGSVKLFVAYYKNLPVNVEDSYLPASATAVIRQARPDLSDDEQAFLDTHTVDCVPNLAALG
jgi:hypothetical protein